MEHEGLLWLLYWLPCSHSFQKNSLSSKIPDTNALASQHDGFVCVTSLLLAANDSTEGREELGVKCDH